ncbi:retrovirus-related pol polyprotein from transposon TNT 1-94 [Tanacetum coccineum]|uniref:Retrovirus-related pol polyprotein from transposon TNT 1-94 n=1 Tax=Tanacetum coccineum TaxID=301880 RepID=A0ABQ5D7K1_9ASTR
MHEDYEYVKSLEKEVDELKSEKADFSNIYDLLLEECVSKDVTCSYLHSLSDLNAYAELQCLYLHKVKECECLAQKLSKQTESVNKEVHNKLLKSFAKLENHSISLELALQQCKEQMKNNSVCKENGSNVFRKEREQYHEIQDLKAQMQDKNIAISELKKLIEKCKGKSVETQFDKPSVVRQPNAQRIPKPSVLGKPTPFSNSPEMRSFQTKQSVNKTNVSDGLFKQVTQQNLPQNRKQAEIHSNVLKPGMYRIATTTTQNREPQLPHASRNTNPHVSKSSGVNHTTSVSRPQLKCYQVKDKVVPNNSQVKFKKKEVEDHHRISSISKKTKSVTACNDSSKSRTLNVNVVCAECGKCVFNSNHDACVSRYLNDVNARTKKPKVVPISASKPKRKANKSVATPHKKTVASDTTIQKSKSYYKELYENTNQEWKWKEDVSTSISPTIDIVFRITNIVQLILFIVDSGCTKHMTGNLKLLCNFVEKFLGTVHFGNDQFAPILGYGDLNQGNITIKRVYYVEGLNHNLFSGNNLLTGNRGSDLYTISLQDTTSSTPICFMAKSSPTQAWLWHQRLSHLNFDYITLLSKKDIVTGLPKGTEFLNKTLHAYFKEEGIEHQTSTPRTPEQNGVVERWNRTLVEAARTMLSASKLPLSFWAEAVATAC